MGTVAHVLVAGDDAPDAVASACLHLCRLERLWSRFDLASEVSRLNNNGGVSVRVSPATLALVQLSVMAYGATAGAFDPTLLGDVVRSGYDRTFREITNESACRARSELARGAAALEIDVAQHAVRVPVDVGIDPGGIGKGLAADLVVDSLLATGATGACVNLGGDARVAGVRPDDARWTFDIESPWGGEALETVQIDDGAIATSTTTTRSWSRGDRLSHHLIDPRSGQPIDTDIVSVTVIAARGWQAEVLTKAVFVAGIRDGCTLVDDLGAAALVATRNRELFTSASWKDFGRTN
jgi:FAD:protein FMN transferase